MKKILSITLAFLIFGSSTIQAQTVTQAWATLASGTGPHDLAIDANGNLYTANLGSNSVSKVTAAGVVTQVWASLGSNKPSRIAVDVLGNVYTSNSISNTVCKITASGLITVFATGADPEGIAIDGSGNVYIANLVSNTVSKITSTGVFTQAWATLAFNANPYSIAVDGSGNVYTANYTNGTVSKITAAAVVTEAWASLQNGSHPSDIIIDGNDNLYIGYDDRFYLCKITSLGMFMQSWVTFTNASSTDIVIDGTGNIYSVYEQTQAIVSKATASAVVTSPWATVVGAYSIAVDASGNVYTANYANSTISKITVATLPIQLTSFVCKNNNDINQLQWQTATENNNKQFEIERSSNSSTFNIIGIVDGAGNSSSIKNYSFNDATPLAGNNYYRLKQIDYDGKFEYSAIILVRVAKIDDIIIYPNPFTEETKIINNYKNAKYVLYNEIAVQIKQGALQIGTNIIGTAPLAKGLYLIKIMQNDTVVKIEKLVKE
jgi:streptogramin lyase